MDEHSNGYDWMDGIHGMLGAIDLAITMPLLFTIYPICQNTVKVPMTLTKQKRCFNGVTEDEKCLNCSNSKWADRYAGF